MGADIQYDNDEAAASQTKETATFFQVRQHFQGPKLNPNVKLKSQHAVVAFKLRTTDQLKVILQQFSLLGSLVLGPFFRPLPL